MIRHRYGHMVHEYYVSRLREIMDARAERLRSLQTKADAEAYVRSIRRKVRTSFGPFPERTPLRARVTGTDEYRRYRLEKVVFESRPGFLVTGNLLIPHAAQEGKRLPAVLGLCGHAGDGKGYDLYQRFAQGLALKGFVCFIIDPISQGERRQFYPDDGGRRPGLCHAHNLMGNQMTLVNEFFGSWRVWDAIRALDYLLARPEVDRTRVGATGNSGGGTLTTYLSALDSRLTMAAPSCYVCSWLANLENELPADAEQNPPNLLALGLDEADLLLCHAPRPTMILSQHDDFFDCRYAHGAYEDLRRVHALLGSRNSAEYFVGPRGHGFFTENREAMYRFFMKHAVVRGPSKERGVRVVEAKRLFAVPRGNTRLAGSRRVFEFTADRAADLEAARGKPSPDQIRRDAARLLGLRRPKSAPAYRVLRWDGCWKPPPAVRGAFLVESEPGIQVPVNVYGPQRPMTCPPTSPVTLYVGHTDSDSEIRKIPRLRKRCSGKTTFAAVDPRGMGGTFPLTCGSATFFEPYGCDYLYAATGEMLGESLLGRRVFDVMRVIDFLRHGGSTEVDLVGRGLGSIIVAFAALLHPSRPSASIFDYLPSYGLIASNPLACWPLSSLLRGCLECFDLPDVYSALGRRLTKSRQWDARMKPARTRKLG